MSCLHSAVTTASSRPRHRRTHASAAACAFSAALMQRRKLNLKAEVESSISHLSSKR